MQIIFILLLVLFFGCEEKQTTNVDEIVFPEKNVSFQNNVYPFIKLKCGLQGCHGDVNPARGIQLTDYSSIIIAYNGALIVQGNPNGSVLVQMIENRLPHNPNLYWNFSDNQKKGIRQWITEGAMNN